jgi:hypothetical protein
MPLILTRRMFAWAGSGLLVGSSGLLAQAQEPAAPSPAAPSPAESKPAGPVEAAFERDYEAPKFKPAWKKPQINRSMVQDFVIFAHADLDKVKMLLEREPGLLNAAIDWGGGDWETGLGGAAHMGRRDIVEFLLSRGARADLFCAAMLGQTEVVRSLLTLQPKLIEAKGPHGFDLHFHAQVGGDQAKATLDYLQSIQPKELKPIPFLKK